MLNSYSNSTNFTECKKDALIDGFGWLIQGILAGLAFTCLILKRLLCELESRKRTWKVWFFDTSKQAIGSIVIHFVNILLAEKLPGDPCNIYIVSFLLDSTVGLLIIFIGIRFCFWYGKHYECRILIFGEYGYPPKKNIWFIQCILYVLLMLIEKCIVILLLHFHFIQMLENVILLPITDPTIRIEVAVLIVPFFMNILMFWVVDNFLMSHVIHSHTQYIKQHDLCSSDSDDSIQ